MLDLLIIILVLLWLTGNFAFHLGSLVHLLLVVAAVVLVVRVLRGERL